MPDPDLLIRTGGELRISNYLLWQIAYSELYFCDTYWPDFNEEELYQAIISYQSRQRRFGKTEAHVYRRLALAALPAPVLDALKAVALPAVEVHLSKISEREAFRHISYTALACEKSYAGFGFEGYRMAMQYLLDHHGSGQS